MKSILKATVILGSSSAASILIGLVSMKAYALLLGVEGLGHLGLLQSVLNLGLLLFGLSLDAGQVRFGAEALSGGDLERAAAFRVASGRILAVSGLCALALSVLFRTPLAAGVLDDPARGGAIAVVTVGVALGLGMRHQLGVLNAHHRVGALARVEVAVALLTPVVLIAWIVPWGERGIAPGLALAGLASWAIAAFVRHRELGPLGARPSRARVREAAAELGRYATSIFTSRVAGSAVVQGLPFLVLHLLGPVGVGLFKASSVISSRYTALLSKALGQDYYPRLSARVNAPEELHPMILEQHRLLLMLATPMLLAMMALGRWVLRLLFSEEFLEALHLLEWQLLTDLLRTTGWSLGFVVLARDSRAYLLSELVGGAGLLIFGAAGLKMGGLDGLGVGMCASYAVYYVVVSFMVRRDLGLRWKPENRRLFGLAVSSLLGLLLLGYTRYAWLEPPVGVGLALLFGARYGRVVWEELRHTEEAG